MVNLIEFYLCEFTKYLLIDYDLIVQKAKVGDGCFRLPWHLLYLSMAGGTWDAREAIASQMLAPTEEKSYSLTLFGTHFDRKKKSIFSAT